MPKTTGLEVLSFVRKAWDRPETPFVIMTAEGEKETVLEAVHLGADGYLTKPFSPESLRDRLTKLQARLASKAAA